MTDISDRVYGGKPPPPAEYRHKNGIMYVICVPERLKYSRWWSYGQLYALPKTPRVINGWLCGEPRCDQFVATKNQSSLVGRHMKQVHKMSTVKDEEEDDTDSIAAPASSQPDSELDLSSTIRSAFKTLMTTINVKRFQDLLLRWCIVDHVPFNKVDSSRFRMFMNACSPSLPPFSRTSLANWADTAFDKEKDNIKRLLHASLSKVHISFDIWNSPNRYGILGIVGHFVVKKEEEYRNQACVLAMTRMKDNHGAEEISEELIRVVLDYKIGEKLGVFQADNPTVNDNAVRLALQRLNPAEKQPKTRRARCIGHILNLAARDFIFGKDCEVFEYEIAGEDPNAQSDSGAARAAQEVWRRKGPIGKLHNLVVFIRGSVQRSEAFGKIRRGDDKTDDLEPILDNDTR